MDKPRQLFEILRTSEDKSETLEKIIRILSEGGNELRTVVMMGDTLLLVGTIGAKAKFDELAEFGLIASQLSVNPIKRTRTSKKKNTPVIAIAPNNTEEELRREKREEARAIDESMARRNK